MTFVKDIEVPGLMVNLNEAFKYAAYIAGFILVVSCCIRIASMASRVCSEVNEDELEEVEITIEDVSSITDTTKQSTGGVAVVGGKFGVYSGSPTSVSETRYYSYLRDNNGNLYQCAADTDTFAAISMYKGKTIKMERSSSKFYWNNMTIKIINTLEKAEETNA